MTQQLITEARGTATVNSSGLLDIQIITPGWGSSGYYSPRLLESAAAEKVFPKGTHLYIDHPTPTEAEERPNRSVKDLAAVLAEDARWDGQSLRAPARTFKAWREDLAEKQEAIGVSIRADASVTEGEAEGRRGVIIEQITNARSVDFVTAAGRGGRILQVLESARNQMLEDALTENEPESEVTAPAPEIAPQDAPPAEPPAPQEAPQNPVAEPVAEPPAAAETAPTTIQQEEHMPEETPSAPSGHPKEIFEARMRQQHNHIVLLEARDTARPVIASTLSEAWITPLVKARITEEVMQALPIKEDKLDQAELIVAIHNKVRVAEAEMGEILEAAGLGRPQGLGAPAPVSTLTEAYDSSLEASLSDLGLSEEAVKTAVRGR